MTGVDRVAEQITVALDGLAAEGALEGASVEIVAPPGKLRNLRLSHVPVRQVGRRSGHLWEQLELPSACRGAVLLNLCNTAPLSVRDAVVMIHDAQVYQTPKSYSRAFRATYRMLLPLAARRARALATVSSFSKAELERFGVAPKNKARVVPNGADHIDAITSDPSTLSRLGLGKGGYALAIGSLAPHKNLATILNAQNRQKGPLRRLVIAGGGNARVFGESGLPECQEALFTGRVADAELKALYEGAAVLLFPSFFEGFGLPPLEAMRCGCPVVASTADAVREVCGDAALYAPPGDGDAWVRRIEEVGGDADLRARLREAGLARAEPFIWRRSAEAILAMTAGS